MVATYIMATPILHRQQEEECYSDEEDDDFFGMQDTVVMIENEYQKKTEKVIQDLEFLHISNFIRGRYYTLRND